MTDIKYNTNTLANSLIPYSIVISLFTNNFQASYNPSKVFYSSLPFENVFQKLSANLEIQYEESRFSFSPMIQFTHQLLTQSKDLDGEITSMVNKNFQDLLLKL